MKAFLLRMKDKIRNGFITAVVWTTIAVLAVIAAVVIAGVYVYYFTKSKVRGAGRWIADKYNTLISKFKTEVAE